MTTKEIFHEMTQTLAKKAQDQLTGSQGIYQFNLTGDDAGSYYVQVQDGVATVGEGTSADPGVTITMEASDFKELAQGRLNPMAAFMSGKLSVAGDMSLALKLQTLIA